MVVWVKVGVGIIYGVGNSVRDRTRVSVSVGERNRAIAGVRVGVGVRDRVVVGVRIRVRFSISVSVRVAGTTIPSEISLASGVLVVGKTSKVSPRALYLTMPITVCYMRSGLSYYLCIAVKASIVYAAVVVRVI